MYKTKQIIFIGIIALLLVTVALVYDHKLQPVETISEKQNISKTSKRLSPNITLTDLSGQKFQLHDLKEPVVFLHFWASWCTPCLVELPDILQLTQDMNGRLAVVAVSIDTDTGKLKAFLKKLRKKYGKMIDNPHIYWVQDTDKTISLKTFNVAKVPETIVIDQNHIMIKKIIGENNWLSAETKALIQ